MSKNVNVNNGYGEVLRGKMNKAGTAVRPITEKQEKLLNALIAKWKVKVSANIKEMTRTQASETIDKIIMAIKEGKITQRPEYVEKKKSVEVKENSSVVVYIIAENLDGITVKSFIGNTKEEACMKAVEKYHEDIKLFTTDLNEVTETARIMKNRREIAVRDLSTNTVKELREIAKSYQVPEYTKYKKDTLCNVLYLHAHNMNKSA
jgi:hypothetical protein